MPEKTDTPPPPVQQVQGPGWVVAKIGNPLDPGPGSLVLGSIMCSPCFPKQIPAFHIHEGSSVCPDCLAKAKGLTNIPPEDQKKGGCCDGK